MTDNEECQYSLMKEEFQPSRRYRNEILASMGPWCCFVAIGFYVSFAAPAIVQLQDEGRLTRDQIAWFASLYYLGGIMGSILSGMMGDFLGRKLTMMLAGTVASIGWLMILTDVHVSFLLIGRFLCGIDAGIGYSAGIAYQIETQRHQFRGGSAVFSSVCTSIGTCLCYLLTGLFSWRWLAVVAIAFDLVFVTSMALLPESPRWCVKHNRIGEAKRGLVWLRMEDTNSASEELSIIQENLQETSKATTSVPLKALLRERRYFQPLLLVCLIYMGSPITGFNAVMTYLWFIFAKSGIGHESVVAVFLSLAQFASNLATSVVADSINRRTLIIASGYGVAVSYLLLSVSDVLRMRGLWERYTEWLALSGLVGVSCWYNVGWHFISVTAAGEVLPTAIRSYGSGIGVAVMYIFKFITTYIFLKLEDSLQQSGTFLVFATTTIICTLLVKQLLPETRGKTLEEIESIFS